MRRLAKSAVCILMLLHLGDVASIIVYVNVSPAVNRGVITGQSVKAVIRIAYGMSAVCIGRDVATLVIGIYVLNSRKIGHRLNERSSPYAVAYLLFYGRAAAKPPPSVQLLSYFVRKNRINLFLWAFIYYILKSMICHSQNNNYHSKYKYCYHRFDISTLSQNDFYHRAHIHY